MEGFAASHAETHDAVIVEITASCVLYSAATDVSCASDHLPRRQRECDDRLLPNLLDHEHNAAVRLRTCFILRRIRYDQARLAIAYRAERAGKSERRKLRPHVLGATLGKREVV